MPVPDPAIEPGGQSTNAGAEVLFFDSSPADYPPKKRKIDPRTIWWPEGEPKPWEKKRPAGLPEGDMPAGA